MGKFFALQEITFMRSYGFVLVPYIQKNHAGDRRILRLYVRLVWLHCGYQFFYSGKCGYH